MAAELVAGALLSAFLQAAVDRLASRQVLDFFCGRNLDETLLSKLKVKLLSIDALANDAEQRQFRDPRVKAWLVDVKDAVFDAEDLLDEIHCKLSKRVLSLCCCSSLRVVPNSVGNLRHLRSLDLSWTDIKKLPDSTYSLYNLQILNLNYCENLEELPSNLHKLTNLRCLQFIGTRVRKVPMHLEKLKNLQVLSSFYIGRSSEFSIQQLGGLNLHGGLSIGELQNIVNPSDALAANLKNKTHLVKLEFEWNSNQIPDDPRKEKEVLENLQPSKHLTDLSIKNYGGTQFPSWLSDYSLSNVVSLNLEDCKYCLHLPSLGLLPFLKYLVIDGLDGIVEIDDDFYGTSSFSFRSLETLEFLNMKEWEEWECKDAFPRLQDLCIKQCPKLKGHLSEQFLHLKSLEISECGRLNISGLNLEVPSLERIGHTVSSSCPNMSISMSYDLLTEMTINGSCDSLTTFPLDLFPKLISLKLKRCRNLQMISQEHSHFHLNHLAIRKCPKFKSFPSKGLVVPRLDSFDIQELENLKLLPKDMHILLRSLTHLSIEDCPELELLSDGGLPSNLEYMGLWNCPKLIASLKGDLGANTSFPGEVFLPISLTFLGIWDCPDLKKLDYKGLCHLSSLEELHLERCPNLQCLPEEGLPKSISTLKIWGCPLLQQRCQETVGEDWGKIADIKNLYIESS